MTELRRGLPALPSRIAKLPLDPRGYPIPWFVGVVDGKRDFRVADQGKRVQAVNRKLCWICGEPLGRMFAFVIGPMCAVNRNTSEPPCHRECAVFAATACPFLCLPKSDYRKPPEGGKMLAGALDGNPGACAVWITKSYRPYIVPGTTGRDRQWLITIGPAHEVLWFAEGRTASRAQIEDSFTRRLPLLREVAQAQGPEACAYLDEQVAVAMALLPA